MQNFDLDFGGILQDILDMIAGWIGWGWGLLPFQSDHSLSLLVWFILATLGGVLIFIKFYGNGIIMESIEYGISETSRNFKRYGGQLNKFAKKSTKRKSYSRKRKRR